MMNTDSQTNSNKKKQLIVAFTAFIGIIVILIIAGFFLLQPKPLIIQGQAEATEVRVSGKLPGRIEKLLVQEGADVKKGDTLAVIYSADVNAKMEQAKAAEEAAAAQNTKVDKGARSEVIQSAYAMWQKSQAGLSIAEKSYKRMQALFDKGIVSAQKRDEAEANYKAMSATEAAAKSQYEMAKRGAQTEDKIAAAALVKRAKGAISEVQAYLSDSYLLAPIDGNVSEIFPEIGELVGPGAPVMNILNLEDMWVTFSVREELLKDLKVDSEVSASIPALNKDQVKFKIYYVKDLGSYAVWKATKATGTYDAKTFEVRARPVEKVEGLRPGMSILINQK